MTKELKEALDRELDAALESDDAEGDCHDERHTRRAGEVSRAPRVGDNQRARRGSHAHYGGRGKVG